MTDITGDTRNRLVTALGASVNADEIVTRLNSAVVGASSVVVGSTTISEAEIGVLDAVTAGTTSASKALVVGATKNVDTLDVVTLKNDGITMSSLKWVDVAVTATLLDGAGLVNVVAAATGDSYKVRNIRLVGGGTNFGGAGNRLIDLTDGTTVWTQIANADIESAPTATLDWGNAKVPFLTSVSNTASVAGQAIRFAYSGGTTDHTTGSITFSVCLEKVA